MIKFLGAVLILSGMIIGAGMFGIPFSFAQAGFWLGAAELVVITGLFLFVHLSYGGIVLATESFHRLPGYVNIYLGKKIAALSWFSAIFGIVGTLLIYLILGSLFLNNFFQSFGLDLKEWFFALFMAGAGLVILFLPIKKITLINGILTAALIGFIFFLIGFLSPKIEFANFAGFTLKNALLPYGVLLFALAGSVIVPDVITFLGREKTSVRSAIVVGTLIPSLVYFLFAFSVVGASGLGVSEEAIRGLKTIAGENLYLLGNVIGFFAVFTSFIVLNKNFQALLTIDLGLGSLASLAVSAIPFALYILGLKNFIAAVSMVGAVAVGIDSVLIILTHRQIRQKEGNTLPFFVNLAGLGICCMIIAGVLYEVYKYL
jgi:tyrosine-specific transport protein